MTRHWKSRWVSTDEINEEADLNTASVKTTGFNTSHNAPQHHLFIKGLVHQEFEALFTKRWRLFEECSWNDSWVLPVCGGGGGGGGGGMFGWMAANVALWQQTPARLQRASQPFLFLLLIMNTSSFKSWEKRQLSFQILKQNCCIRVQRAEPQLGSSHIWKASTTLSLWVWCVHNLKRDWLMLDVLEIISLRATHMMGFCTWFKVSEGKNPEENWDIRANAHNHKPANHS